MEYIGYIGVNIQFARLREDDRKRGLVFIDMYHLPFQIYIDNVSINGELVVTSLDPIFHIGLGFIDQTKPFLNGLTQWLRGSNVNV